MTQVYQRVTFFGDDDETPLLGTVDVDGNVTEASFSTDPAHVRPYLIFQEKGPSVKVDLLEGKASISEVRLSITDKRTDPADQDTGIFTGLLANAGGENQLGGRRVLWEQKIGSGDWYTLINGPVGDHDLADNYSQFDFSVRDIRERERKHKIFTHTETTQLFPRGVRGGYGKIADAPGFSLWMAPPAEDTFFTGTWEMATRLINGSFVQDDRTGRIRMEDPEFQIESIFPLEITGPYQFSEAELDAGTPTPVYNNFDDYLGHFYENIVVAWRLSGSGDPWTEVREMPYLEDGNEPNLFSRRLLTWGGIIRRNYLDRLFIRLASNDVAEVPNDGDVVDFQVWYAGPPTEDFPLHIEGTAGELLINNYTGVYAESNPNVRYDTARMSELAEQTPRMRARIFKPVSDMKSWNEGHIFKPNGMAPTLNGEGEVSPIIYEMPGPGESLLELNNQNTISAKWGHKVSKAITATEFTFIREFWHQGGAPHLASDAITEKEVLNIYESSAAQLIGDERLKYEPTTIRTIGAASLNGQITGDVTDETGRKLAAARGRQSVGRFRYGAQIVTAEVRRSAIGVADQVEGNWVVLGVTWTPDYESGKRGSNRLAQIVAISDIDPITREFTLVDAGAEHAPLAQPTLGAVSSDDDGVVTVPITAVVADTEARVDYAINDTEPDPASGKWTFLGRRGSVGDLRSPPLSTGVTVWIRGRSEADGKRPSAWTPAVSEVIGGGPRLRQVTMVLDPLTGSPIIRWARANSITQGVRIHYAAHDQADVDPTFETADFDAQALIAEIDDLLPLDAQVVTVEVEPWDGFSAGTVSGNAGPAVRRARIWRSPEANGLKLFDFGIERDGDIARFGWRTGPLVKKIVHRHATLPYPVTMGLPFETVKADPDPEVLPPETESYEVAIPPDTEVEYGQFETWGADDEEGYTYRYRIIAGSAGTPAGQLIGVSDGVTATGFLQLQLMGIEVESIEFMAQEGSDPPTAWAEPTRGPGDPSTMFSRNLTEGEWEFDYTLPHDSTLEMSARVTYVGGEVQIFGPLTFDRSAKPAIDSWSVDGTVVYIRVDPDADSLELEDPVSGWSEHVEVPGPGGREFYFDVSEADSSGNPGIGDAETWNMVATAYSEPVGDVDANTLFDDQEITVHGGTATPPQWDPRSNVSVPAVGESDFTHSLMVNAEFDPANHYVEVHEQHDLGGAEAGLTDWLQIDGAGATVQDMDPDPNSAGNEPESGIIKLYTWLSGWVRQESGTQTTWHFRYRIRDNVTDEILDTLTLTRKFYRSDEQAPI